jgi:hypothetical protein
VWEAGAIALVREPRYGSICAVPEIFPDPGVVRNADRLGRLAAVPGSRVVNVSKNREVGG